MLHEMELELSSFVWFSIFTFFQRNTFVKNVPLHSHWMNISLNPLMLKTNMWIYDPFNNNFNIKNNLKESCLGRCLQFILPKIFWVYPWKERVNE